MTSPMLKAMTHPLRRRIIALMAPDLPLRAADLAAQLGEPANSVSFHLRKLAEAGLIVEAPEHARDRRDRVWVGAGTGYGIPLPGTLAEEDEPVLHALLDQQAIDLQELVRRTLTWAGEWSSGRDETHRAELNIGTLSLTRTEMLTLVEEVGEVFERARAVRTTEPPEGEERQDWEFMAVIAELGLGRADGPGPAGPAAPPPTGASPG